MDHVIGTPGRLQDLVLKPDRFSGQRILSLSMVHFVVLDEADMMLELGFEHQVRRLLVEVAEERQVLCFSATWPKKACWMRLRWPTAGAGAVRRALAEGRSRARALTKEYLRSPLRWVLWKGFRATATCCSTSGELRPSRFWGMRRLVDRDRRAPASESLHENIQERS